MKPQTPPRTRESPIVMDLADLEHCAVEIISHARQDAARILADAKSAAQRETLHIREQARQAGHQEGLQTGLAEGRKQGHDEALASVAAQLKDLSSRWSQTLDLLHQHMPEHVADARMDLVQLALAIARRVTLLVHPGEADALEIYLPDLLAKLRSIEEVELTLDDTVSPGGCVARFGTGQIDARIETQLDRIAAELLDQKDGNSAA